MGVHPEGITVPVMAGCCGVSARMIDYWDRTGVLPPSVTPARGSGTPRLYSPEDACVGRALGVLARLGCRNPALGMAAHQLRTKVGAWTGHVYVDRHGYLHLAMPEGGGWCIDLTWAARHPCCAQGRLVAV